ncbi:tryptophan--tRNA ligase [Candidatus Phytoplasma bonamiae]|uniref:Tryptophan--tRNA ligase n=1 Tax=Candidatus Phytoplasma bonamiae TaxID=2982626 RepID=A0ABT9D3I7_9MOLU|nr:tryptophan--tRNA ligase ['Bonamia sp.' little leaf phytoplasma]MDO8063969.1 tryptophan--tRNA ligase ['Bonamia sp.' little leaf phytoplasma]MDV3174682.1 tryptophan--tRNA ligase ['Bonamia sp.' little leaf phytoplasma]
MNNKFLKKKIIITGIKPSGDLTLGNWLGIIQPLILLQKKFPEQYEFYFFIADLHALTTFSKEFDLKKVIRNITAILLSSGLSLSKTTFFLQSDIFAHTYLSYILECNTYLGELNRMIQFKEKNKKKSSNVKVSLLTYPILMASDILLYDADIVIVGKDQKQHLELTRDLAIRFNSFYGNFFKIPEFLNIGYTINSLTNPDKKMSKSSFLDKDQDKGCIFLLEDLNNIQTKVMQAVTDNIGKINYDPQTQPGISNLLTIYAGLKGIEISQAEFLFSNYSYREFKIKLAFLILEKIKIIQNNFKNIINDVILENTLSNGAFKANTISQQKVNKIREILGIKYSF